MTTAGASFVPQKTTEGSNTLLGEQDSNAFEIWDTHCHLSSVNGKTPRERATEFLEIADVMGIQKVVIFMGWPFSIDPSPEIFKKQNDQVIEAMSTNPERILAYAYVNPNHVDSSLEEMDRCFENPGMVGIKLWVASRCDEASLAPIIRKAQEKQKVIFQHSWFKTTGNLKGESTPSQLAILAEKFPEANFVCGHTGGVWEMGIRAVRKYPNIFVEMAGFAPTAGFVEMAVRELGAERILYGSDSGGRTFASQIAKVTGAEISDRDKRMIFKDNFQKLITPTD